MRLSFTALLSLSLLATPLVAQERSIIVLDGSGSMWGQIDGRPKLEIAREALGKVVQGIDPESELGLMAYGHRSRGQCDDIELIVPPARGTAASIVSAANAMKFQGKTPLSDAVRMAAGHLRFEEDRATVILITDGIETCDADPCALASELEASGIDFTAHVVGFGMSRSEGEAVACLAHNTGGKFIEAKDAATLEAALQETVVQPPAADPEPAPAEPAVLESNIRPQVALSEGSEIGTYRMRTQFTFFAEEGGAAVGETLLTLSGHQPGKLPAGRYIMRSTADLASVDQLIEVSDTEMAEPLVILDAAHILLTAVTKTGGKGDKSAALELSGPDGKIRRQGVLDLIVPAGEHAVRGEHSGAVIDESLVAEAGQVIERNMVFAVGTVQISVTYDGKAPADFHYYVAVLDPVSKEQRATVNARDASVSLMPGEYIAELRGLAYMKPQVPFTVTADQNVQAEIVLNAGLLSVTAPKNTYLRILGQEKGIDGKHPEVTSRISATSEELTFPLAAGSYILQSTINKVERQQPFTISAGQRVEVSAN